jgi:V8-like Glu-specific endopeptidase
MTLAPLFPAPDLYPIVGFDEGEIIPILGPSQGAELEEEFGLPLATPQLDDVTGPPEGLPGVVGITDGNVVPIINFPISELGPGPSPPPLVGAETPTPVITAIPAAEEAICGVDDSQDVEFYDGTLGVTRTFVDANQPPVGNIQWNFNLHALFPGSAGNVNGVRWCSGALIADDLFLTAGHCFEPDLGSWRTPRVNGVPISRQEIARNMRVNFNYQWGPDGPRTETSVPIVDLVEDRLGDRDYAIVQLAANPGPIFGRARVAMADAPQGSTISIIGHPVGLPKRVEAGIASQYQGPNLYYNDIDTEGGSSGSCILVAPDGLLVGIHTNGGCNDPAVGNNYGFRIEALLEVSPILRDLAAT